MIDMPVIGCAYNGLIFQPISKCASCSLSGSLFKAGGTKIVNYKNIKLPLVVMWREPHDRMQSAYKFLHRARAPEMCFSDWVVLHCTADEADPHIVPQTKHIEPRRPDIFLKWNFDEFKRLFNIKGPLPRIFESKPQETVWTDKSIDIFDSFYKDDLCVWEQTS